MQMQSPFFAALTIAGATACASTGSVAETRPHGRPCDDVVDYPVDTALDFRRGVQTGPRSISRDGPKYPPEMLTQSVEGSVRASFVVDTTGHIPRGTVFISAESDFAFGYAVCRWLGGDTRRFEPFEVGGRRYSVRMMNVPVEFTLTRVP
jgi:hypothetical protein